MHRDEPIPHFVGPPEGSGRRRLIAAAIFMSTLGIGAAIAVEFAEPGDDLTRSIEPGTPETGSSENASASDGSTRQQELERIVEQAEAANLRARTALEAARLEGVDGALIDDMERRVRMSRGTTESATTRLPPRPIEVLPVLPADGRTL